MNRPHLRWSDYDNNGDILPDGYKRLKEGTIVNSEIRWTDKVSIDAEGNIRDFNGNVLYSLKEEEDE